MKTIENNQMNKSGDLDFKNSNHGIADVELNDVTQTWSLQRRIKRLTLSHHTLTGKPYMVRSDAESTRAHSDHELRRKKRIKCLVYIAVFAVFQIIVITVFALTIMRVKSPKFRIQSVTVEDLTTSNTGNNPSRTMRFIAHVSVKNPNFGRYKYDQGSISFTYKGTQVGDAIVPKETARTKSTRKTNLTGAVTTVNSNLDGDISSGSVMLSTYSKISGKVYLMNMIKKKKSAEMKCTMTVNLTSKQVQDIKCN